MSRFVSYLRLCVFSTYGCPPHPAIYRDATGVWRCTECHGLI